MDDALNILIITCRADLTQAKRLQSFLLKYKVPRHLVGEKIPDGRVPSKINRADICIEQPFSDDSEALNARYAIALCSPEAVASSDVHNWLLAYKRRHRESQVLCYILSGEPNASDKPESGQAEAFPEAVRFVIEGQGQLSEKRTEPIAADSRQHADGEKNARLKLLAGILAVRYEELHQRAKKQQQQRLALAAGVFLAIVSYGVSVYWQQYQQKQAKLQKEFNSASKATFDALNRQQSGAMKKVSELRQLATQVEDSAAIMKALDFRLSHSQLKGQDIAHNKPIDFVLTSNDGKAYGVSLADGKLGLTRENGKTIEFSLETVNWQRSVHFKQESSLASIEIVNDALAWVVIDSGDYWHVMRLNLSNNNATVLEPQQSKRMVSREYPQKTEKFDRNLNLKDGQVMIVTDDQVGIYDANDEARYLTSLPGQLSLSELKSNHDIHLKWHRESQSLLLWNEQRGLWPWFYTKQPSFEAAIYTGASEAVNIHDKNWLSINLRDSDSNHTSTVINLYDKRRFDHIPSHVVWLGSHKRRLRILTARFDLERSEVWLDAQSGAVKSRRFIDYQLGFGENEKYYLDEGYLYRQSEDYITSLGRWKVPCHKNATLAKDGSLHCVINNQWRRFKPDEAQKQKAITLPGYIQTYVQQESNIWAISNTAKSYISVIARDAKNLILSLQQQAKNSCYHRLEPVDSDFIYVMLSAGGRGIFKNGPCVVTLPLTGAAFEIDKQQLVSTQNPVNLDLLSNKGVFIPTYDIAGVYRDKTNMHWFTTTQSGVFKRGLMKPFVWTEEKQPIYFSRNPRTNDLAVSEYNLSDDKQQITLSLTIRDSSGAKVLREIASKPFDANSVDKEYWLHGFSADGNLFWWAPYGEASDINWVDVGGKAKSEVMERLPQQMNVAFDYLKFSLFGDFVIHAQPYTTGRHRVFNTLNGEKVFESTTQGSFAVNKTRIDLHRQYPWLIYDGKVYDLSSQGQEINVDYFDNISLFDFHPNRPWAAGRCGEQDICIVDLQLGQVIMLKTLQRPSYSLEKQPQQIRFSQSGDSLLYVLAGRSLVEQQLFTD